MAIPDIILLKWNANTNTVHLLTRSTLISFGGS